MCCNGDWQTTKSCVWHETINTGYYTPIAALYPELENFFVNILGVPIVTDVFIMDELAKEASQPILDESRIRSLMLSAGDMLGFNSETSKFHSSIGILQQHAFMPCKSPTGKSEFLALDDTFLVVDNVEFAEAFEGKLQLLEFTYEELNSLHTLLRLLLLEDRYLSRNVTLETHEGNSTFHGGLTQQFQECAYAFSW